MANTTNFGWETPDDTDLVKDGALAMRTLGNAIDTSLVDLKGGTTGQILAKNTNTDMDFVWVNNDQGDITAVNVSSPITGGGTSGAVTVGIQDGTTTQKGAVQLENSVSSTSTTTAAVPASVKSAYDLADAAIPESIVDAKGDLIVATAADTVSRLAVGSNDQVLTADSSTATGLKWASAAASSGPAFEARRNGNQSLTSGTVTKIQFNQEDYDTDNCYDPTTNYRFTPNKAGYYQVNICGYVEVTSGVVRNITSIYKNGSSYCRVSDVESNNTVNQQAGSALIYLNGSSDYIEGYIQGFGTAPQIADNGAGFEAYFSAVWIRS